MLPAGLRFALVGLALAVQLSLGFLVSPAPAWAGPVDWQEVPASARGRQWWDAGSLRVDRQGRLTVLSRFQPAQATEEEAREEGNGAGDGGNARSRPLRGSLYVMQLDCEQELYRDTSVNGIPRLRAEWQAAAADELTTRTLRAACGAGASLLADARSGAGRG